MCQTKMRPGKNMHKHKRTTLSKGMREIIIRVRHYFEMEYQNGGPTMAVNRPVDRTAAATGMSLYQINRITKKIYGFSNQEDDQQPPKKTKKKPKKDYNKEICRVFIYAYDKLYPYDSRIQLRRAMRKAGIYFGGKASFYKMLLELGVPVCCPRPKRKPAVLNTDAETTYEEPKNTEITLEVNKENATKAKEEDPLVGCSYKNAE